MEVLKCQGHALRVSIRGWSTPARATLAIDPLLVKQLLSSVGFVAKRAACFLHNECQLEEER